MRSAGLIDLGSAIDPILNFLSPKHTYTRDRKMGLQGYSSDAQAYAGSSAQTIPDE
jgi:hypothetical protein